ncbi:MULTISPECIES: ORC1-type DNA replication protein [Methanocorpusculum]|jgi:archaeal cell division control protein 6|uniref:ORC1-type DNA replication protein n=1 Tax=Methanocorpusculum parvum TaxID=2193 RepID=A0AAX0Q7I0_9EURY|nr:MULTISPECIES: ORC1-type DNA replication protein [Methanocorpusculum]MDD2248470.1 ORC1-type DNA replication protein [Methanocorpusculum sp.]MDD2802864.1 ORC1-type DNA replication protein [Methanocorpusculum sp.]MDD3046821.1 ORC1-type DNA replication protein [Methanocorpusculum sp.]MDD3911894.1 ORC1-type DNA replication protein [Methanocorpusculum sp.]MDD4423375.1 ORC1-type DNA replication protein [Methanocorpusculum parvum]
MKKNLLMWDQTLFRDIEVFEITYVPEQFDYRDEQIERLAFAVKPALIGGSILNTICRGVPGTGKTTSVKKFFEEVEGAATKIVPIHINCQIDSTEYAVFSRIYTKLTKNRQPPSGTAFKTLMDMLAKYVEKEEVIPLICLDDANYLIYNKEFNNVLYAALRIHEVYQKIAIGVIVVISDPDILLESILDARVASVFRYETVNFEPYSAAEVAGILSQRVAQGLYPNVLTSEQLDYIVDRTMRCGDIRIGLDMIKRAVMYAETDARRAVTQEDLQKAASASQDLHLAGTIKTLSPDELQILEQLVKMTGTQTLLTTGDLRRSMTKDAPKLTRFNEIVEKLDHLRVITVDYANKGSGRKRYVNLRYEKERVSKLLQKKN